MHFLAQSPPRDPVQVLQSPFFSNISCRAPNSPQCRRAYFDKSQRPTEANFFPRSDMNLRSTITRKRPRIEVKEDHLKLPTERSFHARGQVENIEMNFNDFSPASKRSGTRRYQFQSGMTSDNIYEVPQKVARVTSKSFENNAKSSFDEFSRRLGVGWSSVLDTDLDVQAAVRGWSNFIEKHFPISNVNIRLRSKGLGCFLVEANEGYFLFGDDLKQGKLVSTNLENVWTNLQGPVPVFEGEILNRSYEKSTINPQKDLRSIDMFQSSRFEPLVIQGQCF
ncbi:hypothetical protein HI914_03084 [Erysiphe necator]|nr:hypothetical protein HI914_03084 [Erysiphe necator]